MRRPTALSLMALPLVVLGATALMGCPGGAGDGAATPARPSPAARGEYLVKSIGCADCHTPWKLGPNGPAPDATRWLSGHPESLVITAPAPAAGLPWGMTGALTNTAWSGPWGVSFTANLTPDRETGLGTWTAETFRTALRTGKHMGKGRPILPPMPAFAYANMTDEDLDAVFAYLQSLPPLRNRVPEPLPPAEAAAAN